MPQLIWRALRTHPWLMWLSLALLFSSVANGLTYVIVFARLLSSQATPISLTLAWMLTLAPGLPASYIAVKLLCRQPAFQVLLIGETINLCGLIFPLLALQFDSPLLLLISQSTGAIASGFAVPVLSHLFKQGLRQEWMPAAAGIETLSFAANVIFGVGIGILLYGTFSLWSLLLLDTLSAVLAIVLLIKAGRLFTPHDQTIPPKPVNRLDWRQLSPLQIRSLLLLPCLALVGTPAMALLPILTHRLPGESDDNGLLLLFARSIGQLLIPLLFLPSEKTAQRLRISPLLLALLCFILCYFLVTLTSSIWLAGLWVIIAHLFSNAVYIIATYSVMRNIDQQLVGSAMAASWRLQVMITLVMSIITGLLASCIPAQWALLALGLSGLLLAIVILSYLPVRIRLNSTGQPERRLNHASKAENDDNKHLLRQNETEK